MINQSFGVARTERKIREVFTKAKEKASKDAPVLVYFGEMERAVPHGDTTHP